MWAADHPVLEVLRARHAGHTDDHVVGVAVEGGGMRGVVSGAMLVALAELGFRDRVDRVYGASAGAINAAHFLASNGNTRHLLGTYWRDLCDPRFINLRRALHTSVLDHEYLFETVFASRTPLDYAAALSSSPSLHVAVTLVDDQRTESATDFTDVADLKEALRASTWLPVAVRGHATFRDRRALDGAILTPHPVDLAITDGCTHVLSLSTRPIGHQRHHPSPVQRLAAHHMDRLSPGLGDGYLAGLAHYRRLREWLARGSADGPPYVLDLAPPPESRPVGHLEMSPARLRTAAAEADQVVRQALSEHPSAPETTAGSPPPESPAPPPPATDPARPDHRRR